LTAAAVAAALVPSAPLFGAPAAATSPVLRIGLEAGGTLTWELRVIHELGIDRKYGLRLRAIQYSTKYAAEMALRAGEVDIKVDDWLYPTRARSEGVPVRAVDAFSRAVGGVVTRAAGPIRTIADLRGRRLGIPSYGDKSYLVLRAVAATRFDFDPQKDSQIISAAPPLLAELLERGDVDAVVQYWQFIPRLLATGRFRELVSTGQLVGGLASPGLPLLVVVAADRAIKAEPVPLKMLLLAIHEAKQQLGARADLWEMLTRDGTLVLSDAGLLAGLMARYRAGLPGAWDSATISGLERMTAKLVEIAGPEVVGVSRMDPQASSLDLAPIR
jgi:NitT/TauT family transport system substrate-binding protein